MKRILSIAILALTLVCGLKAQADLQPLPMDPAVRYGKLPNGLTYYIRHNDLPEHHAEFYIAQRVGSILEEKNQRGLAHFLEHMAFNGTKNFPGKGVLDYLERNGVKFGTNVNAYTSIDETVYNISDVPTDESHPGIIDSCLLILHDWSGYISLEDKEIEDERGVIHEEWRSSTSATMRMYDVILPKLYPGNRYADCLPIGSKAGDDHLAVVDDFKPEELRDYYHKWYRPDLQGIFVVGDVDVDAVEQKITELWSDIHVPDGAPVRTYFPVEDNVEPLVAVASDPEQQYNLLEVMWKTDPLPDEMKLTPVGLMQSLMLNIVTTAVDQRLDELSQKADAPYLQAGVGYSEYVLSRTKDCLGLSVIFAEGKYEQGLNAAMQVLLSAVEYGVTDAEVERAKANILSSYENAFNERDKRKNYQFVGEMQSHFIDSEAMPGIEQEYQLVQMILPSFNAAMLNQILPQLVTPQNVALLLMGQQKEGNVLPTEAELLAAYQRSLQQELTPYEEALSGQQLMEGVPANAGTIVSEQEGPFGSTIWTLSNGATVVWKQTDFKKDQIQFSASSMGGSRLMPELHAIERLYLDNIFTMGGVGDYSVTDLPKVLAGKRAGLSTQINGRSEGLSGSSAPKDLRTLFELIHLRMTRPRIDDEAYQAWYNRVETSMQMEVDNPNKILNDSLTLTLYKGQPDEAPVQLEDLKRLDYHRLLDVAAHRFDNAGDFTFYFVGNVDVDSLRQMSCQYLASLPSTSTREQRPAPVLETKGSRQNIFDLPMQDPKTIVYTTYLYDQPYSLKASLVNSMLGQALTMIFTETIREQEGAAYSPQASASLTVEGQGQMVYYYETGADKLDRAEALAKAEIQKLADEGVPADKFQKIHDYMVKRHQESLIENGYWLGSIMNQLEWQVDAVSGYDEALESISIADLQQAACQFLSPEATCIKFVARGVMAE